MNKKEEINKLKERIKKIEKSIGIDKWSDWDCVLKRLDRLEKFRKQKECSHFDWEFDINSIGGYKRCTTCGEIEFLDKDAIIARKKFIEEQIETFQKSLEKLNASNND